MGQKPSVKIGVEGSCDRQPAAATSIFNFVSSNPWVMCVPSTLLILSNSSGGSLRSCAIRSSLVMPACDCSLAPVGCSNPRSCRSFLTFLTEISAPSSKSLSNCFTASLASSGSWNTTKYVVGDSLRICSTSPTSVANAYKALSNPGQGCC